jgi:hypothetical protein
MASSEHGVLWIHADHVNGYSPPKIDQARRRRVSGSPTDDDDGFGRWTLIMLAAGDAVATIFVPKVALAVLGFNY